MYDFYLTNGDLTIQDSKVITCDKDKLLYQMALCRIMSIKTDWFGDGIGCDLEQYFGSFLSEDLVKTIENAITSNLTYDGLTTKENIYITNEYIKNTHILKLNVYIQSVVDTTKAFCINVILDIIKNNLTLEGGE
jgi:hypothetical protein